MANESSFLEADSFLDLPPLRQIDRSLVLHHLSTMFLSDSYGNVVVTSETVFLTESKMLVLDRKFHRILFITILDEVPFLQITASHMLGLPISNLVVLSSMMFAGLVHTKNKKGIAIFDLPSTESDSDTIVHPRTFKEYNTKLTNLCSSVSGDFLYSVSLYHGLSCLLTISCENLEVTSTRPFSCVTMEESQKSKISSLSVTPDPKVVFILDTGLGHTARMELDSGNCRSFASDVSFEAVGLTFTTDAVMLHHGYKTTLMTPMGIVIKTFERKHYCVGAVGLYEGI